MAWSITLNGNTYTDADMAKYGYITKLPALLADAATDFAAKVGAALGYSNSAGTSAGAATTQANNASASATLASQWATTTGAQVATTDYSAKEYAVGTFTRGSVGSAKDWATYLGGTVDATGYSAKLWATKATTKVDGVYYSAYQYALNAGVSAGNAATSETNAVAAAVAAQAAAASVGFSDVVFINAASSPYAITQASAGKLISVDTSAGAVVINMPVIAGLSLPFTVGVKKATTDANAVTINRGGTDLFDDGATSGSLLAVGGVTLIPDTDTTPDKWTAVAWGGTTTSGANIWTGMQTFRDNKLEITDDADTTKKLVFQASGVATGQTATISYSASFTLSGGYATTFAIPGAYTYTFPGATGTLLSTAATATLGKGFTVTPNNLGNIVSFTVDPALGNYQYGTNHGAATWTAPANDCGVDVLVTNDATAGAITFSGFTVGSSTGDALTTTNGHKFLIMIRRINSVSTYAIKALQ